MLYQMFDGDQFKDDDMNSAYTMHRRNYKCIYKIILKTQREETNWESRWESNIKTNLRDLPCEVADCIHLGLD